MEILELKQDTEDKFDEEPIEERSFNEKDII